MKKMLSCVLAGTLALQGTQNFANAADHGRIQIGSASIGAGKTFELPVVIEENPGIAALNLSLTYDTDKLELLGAADGKILGTSTFLTTDSLTKTPYILSWDDLSTENNTGTGTAATLSFRAKDNAVGSAKVSVEVNQRSTYNVDLEEVVFETVSGAVSITADENAPAVIADTVSGNQGDTVEMPIKILNNPGIAALNLSISYDNTKLKLLSVEDKKILGTSTFLATDSLTKIPYILSWDDLSTENNTENGIVAMLKFEVLAAEGEATVEIAINQKSTYNVDLEEVHFAAVNGSVNIGSRTTTLITSASKETTTTATSKTSAQVTSTSKSTATSTLTSTSKKSTVTTILSAFNTTETTSAMPESAAIIAGTVSGNQGDTVKVPISIQNNPGIAALNLSISYDTAKLKLLGAEDKKILGTSTFLTTDSLTKIPYILSWDDLSTENNTGNGIVAMLKFEVLAAEGEAMVEIAVNQKSTYNVDLEEVVFSVMNGTVIVRTSEPQATSTTAKPTTTVTTSTTAKLTTTITTSTTAKPTTTVTTSTTAKPTTTVTTSTTAKPTTTVTTSTTVKPTTTVTTSTTAKPTTTVTTSTTTSTKEPLMGDVNGDGEVSIADAVLLCRITAEDSCDDITLTEQSFIAADYDKDNLITILDVMKLLKYLQAHPAT